MRTHCPRLRLAVGSILACLAGAPCLAQPTMTGLGDLPGGSFESEAWGVSADGSTVVGASIINGNVLFGATYAAFRWTAQTGIVDIHDLGGIGTTCRAYAVNADGTMVAGVADYGVLTPTQAVAFIWQSEFGALEIGDLPGGAVHAAARGVSADGSILAGQGTSDFGAEPFRCIVATQTFLGLGDLPGGTFGGSGYGISADGLTIVGSSMTDTGTHAFRWTQGTGMIDLGHLGVPAGGTPFSEAYAASADGSVIVGLSRSPTSGNGWEAFRWTQAGGMTGLGDLAGGDVLSEAYALTPDGSIIVGKGGVLGNCGPFGCPTAPHAFIWDAANGIRDLNVVLPALGLNLNGWVLSEARGISADGRVIVGTGTDPAGNVEAWRVDLGTPPPPPCYPNCDSSTTPPVLNVLDFSCFLNRFAAGDSYSNCDSSTTPPVLNVLDFACFLNAFAAGCP